MIRSYSEPSIQFDGYCPPKEIRNEIAKILQEETIFFGSSNDSINEKPIIKKYKVNEPMDAGEHIGVYTLNKDKKDSDVLE